jgi:hypothetical protein
MSQRTLLLQRRATPGQEGRSRPSAGLAGPQHHKLMNLAASLQAAPAVQRLAAMRPVQRKAASPPAGAGGVVQRIIRSAAGPAGPVFEVHGRAGPHNTAANRNGLDELRLDRHANENAPALHANNPLETAVVVANANSTAGTGLHMAHHVSDAVIQDTIAQAANNYNLAAAPALAPWAETQALINGIAPPAAAAAMPNFYAAAVAAHNNALFELAALMAVHPIPHVPAMDVHLTALANAIANSPMNLHHGDGRTNMSLGRHGDPNNFHRPLLGRQMTWRSAQMRASLLAAGFNPAAEDRTHADALGLHGTLAQQQAMLFPGEPPTSIHNSATGFF